MPAFKRLRIWGMEVLMNRKQRKQRRRQLSNLYAEKHTENLEMERLRLERIAKREEEARAEAEARQKALVEKPEVLEPEVLPPVSKEESDIALLLKATRMFGGW